MLSGDLTPHQGGFTYVGLIVLVAIIGLTGAATLRIESVMRRGAAEAELLEIGTEFSSALESYALSTPPGHNQYPQSLQDLIRDPRFPSPRRHLRKIYVDPIMGTTEWGLLYRADEVGIVAVFSKSDSRPMKGTRYEGNVQSKVPAKRISDWKFYRSTHEADPSLTDTELGPGHVGHPRV